MKLTITLDILPSEVIALLHGLHQTNTPETTTAPSVRFVRILDNAKNRESAFWTRYVDRIGRIIKEAPDGLYDLMFDGDAVPIEGVDSSRFA